MKQINNKIKAIIFDMDGTVVKTEHIWGQSTISVIKEEISKSKKLGNLLSEKIFNVDEEFLTQLFGIGMFKGTTLIKEKFGLEISTDDLMKKQIKLAGQYFATESTTIPFVDGFPEFHKELKQNLFLTSIATNAGLETISIIDRKVNLKSFFGNHLYCMDDVNHKEKPDPAIFLYAAAKLGVKPEECIVFEDSIHGFQAAKAAGMKCIGIRNKINEKQLKHVNTSISSYHEAKAAIKRII